MNHSHIEQQDIIDLFLLGKLSPEVEADFADHFLTCPECLERLESSREAIALAREACVAEQWKVEEQRAWDPQGRQFLFRLPVWGLAGAVGLAALSITLARRPAPPPSESATPRAERPAFVRPAVLPVVELQTHRTGAASTRISAAVTAQPFTLRLDLLGLEPYDRYAVSIVADSGQPVWSQTGAGPSGEHQLELRVEDGRLQPGAFWVRLWSTRQDGGADLLREYSLVVER